MEQPLVSVIVVSYNHSKYIRENLDSIKAQTYPNIELIIADDASKDNSVEVFEAWLSENNYSAKKNFHKQNTGLATTLNECLEMVSGKYVKLIAADDYLHPESIKKCVEKLEELGEDYGMVFTDTYIVNDKSKIIESVVDYSKFSSMSEEELKESLLINNIIAALTTLLSTKALRETGKYDSTFLVEDYYRWLKISEKYLISYIDEKLAYYRFHEYNISKEKSDRIRRETLLFRMMFDRKGILKDQINFFFWEMYSRKRDRDIELLQEYFKYPFRSRLMSICLKYNISRNIYKIMAKFL